MNHYVKMAGAVCAGILGAKFVEAGVKTVAGVFASAAAKVAGMNKAEDAEAPKPEKKAPEKKDGQGKKDDKKSGGKDDKKPAAEAE